MKHDDDFNIIDQAVFGYSNGHRLLGSTVNLSSVDNYDLAALSDLAPGVQISDPASYLSGAPLSDGRYALVRTWAAPEMPRPGCVWSHVLLISRVALQSQIDLTALLPLFRRPHGYSSDGGFSERLSVAKRAADIPAPDPRSVEHALAAVYQASSVDMAEIDADQWERGVLAVWSQQWPRLRSTFVFRSVASPYPLKGQSIRYLWNRSASQPLQRPDWMHEAAADVLSRRITPLRRFLWRYGKDIQPGNNAFADLVRFFEMSIRGDAGLAEAVFRRFGAGQAETLKSDLLGRSAPMLSQVRAASSSELEQLAAHGLIDAAGHPPA